MCCLCGYCSDLRGVVGYEVEKKVIVFALKFFGKVGGIRMLIESIVEFGGLSY